MSKAGRFLNSVGKEFVYGAHLPAFVALSISFSSAILLNIPITRDFLLVVYLIFYIIYSYNRFREFESDFLTNLSRTRHIEKYVKHLPFIILCSFLAVVLLLAYFGNFQSIIFGILIIVSGLLYTVYFKSATKKIVGFKSFYVSFVWASLVIFLAFHYSFPLNLSVFFISTFIFLRVLLNTIFFDIKDIESDKKDNLETIPIFLGKNKTLKYLNILNIVSFIPVVAGVYKNVLHPISLSLIIFFFYSFYYLHKAKSKKVNIQNLSYTIVDGEYLFWSLVLFFSKFILNV